MARSIAQRTLRDFLQETEDAISSGRIDAALANCQTILASFPESLEAQRLLGEVYLAQGHLQEALHAFDWVLTNDPENVVAYCNRAMVSERMSDIDTALDCYQQAYELSRGNGQIRQEFTQLSAKVGQQGFVFSRAGLARLYMRGDLLSQAIQEWEAVLTATPERLDARTGLLETYWREGSLDKVEELATHILRDVSGCLKALVLLAHVTAPKDMARAQTLLRQGEALDPDLVMAQELFADILAHYPNDPFLRLLKKAPSVVNASPAPNMSPQATSGPSTSFSSPSGQLPMAGVDTLGSSGIRPQWEIGQDFSGGQPQWEIGQGSGNSAAFLPPFSDGQLQQNNSFPGTMGQTPINSDASQGDRRPGTASGFEPSDQAVHLSSDLTPMTGSWTMQDVSLSSAPSREAQPEPWEMLQDALHNLPSVPSEESQPSEPWEMLQDALHNMSSSGVRSLDQEQGEPQHWENQSAVSYLGGREESWQSQSRDTFAEPGPGSNDSWVSPSGSYGTEGSDWALPTQENTPPSWLSMLTQADHKEMTAPIPPVNDTSSAPRQPEEVLAAPPQEPVTHQPATSLPSSSQREELQPASSADDEDFAFSVDGDDEEESGFGPAWLKSLGATILDEEEASQPEQSVPSLSPLSIEPSKPEQPAAYASPNAFEAALQEQPVAYDPWKISKPEVQSSAYDPWRASVSEPQKQPVAHEAQKISDLQEQVKISEPQPEPVSSSSAKVEQDLVATLEELEQHLYAKGFVAMEPKSLSAIAQAEETKSTNTVTPLSVQRTSQPVQETSQKQPLPSALAELGMMFHQSDGETSPPVSATALTPDAADFPAEPLWLQTLRSVPVSESGEFAASPAFRTPIVSRPIPPVNISQELPNTPQVHMEAVSGLIFEPTPTSVSSSAVSKEARSNEWSGHSYSCQSVP